MFLLAAPAGLPRGTCFGFIDRSALGQRSIAQTVFLAGSMPRPCAADSGRAWRRGPLGCTAPSRGQESSWRTSRTLGILSPQAIHPTKLLCHPAPAARFRQGLTPSSQCQGTGEAGRRNGDSVQPDNRVRGTGQAWRHNRGRVSGTDEFLSLSTWHFSLLKDSTWIRKTGDQDSVMIAS
jgi:hypothetical protein